MERFVSLKKNSDFGRVYRQGRSYGSRLLVMYVLSGEPENAGRVGISVSKKVGNSVVRHRIKRLIKENIRLNPDLIEKNSDYVFIARKDAQNASYHDIERSLIKLVSRHREVLRHD